MNLLTSLEQKNICGFPMLMMIGQRGMANIVNETQHLFQGGITEEILSTLEIRYLLLDKDQDRKSVCELP